MDFDRRQVLAGTVAAAAGGLFTATAGARQTAPAVASAGGFDAATGEYVLPPLDYAYDALSVAIDEQTMKLHHDIHHLGYVKGLNKALSGLAEARTSGEFGLVKHLSREIAFHGAGHLLHCVFWKNMAPPGAGGELGGDLAKALTSSFGSVDAFKKHFAAASNQVEGSGWGILAWEPVAGALRILQAEKHQDLTQWGVVPLLVLDVWEHAYYLKYQNRRAEYTEAFWKVVNWNDVAARFAAARG